MDGEIGTRSISSPAVFRASQTYESVGSDNSAITQLASDKTEWTHFPRKSVTHRLPFGSGIVVKSTYRVPTRILREIFTKLDQRDSPRKPGKVTRATMESALQRFYGIFDESKGMDLELKSDLDDALDELKKQAGKKRHRVTHDGSEALIYWDQETFFKCFRVSLRTAERYFFTFDISENTTIASRAVSFIIMIAVVVSIITFVIGTLPDQSAEFNVALAWVDLVCVIIFSIDLIVRSITVPYARMELLDRSFLEDLLMNRNDRVLLSSRQRLYTFLLSPMGLVDFISVVPFWIELASSGMAGMMSDSNSDSEILRVMRLARIVRVFKMGKMAEADLGEDRNMVIVLFGEVVNKAGVALQLVGLLILLALLVFGSLIWYAEKGTYFAQGAPNCPHQNLCASAAIRIRQHADGSFEDSASPFIHIPHAFWWVLVTITTVGYGDYFPITPMGYAVGGVCIIYGVMVFALPVGIIGTAFAQAYDSFLSEQALRKSLQLQEEAAKSRRDSCIESLSQTAPSDVPEVVVDVKVALHQSALAMGLSAAMYKRWEADLDKMAKFEQLASNPCVQLELWGAPILALFDQHAQHAEPMAAKCLSRYRVAWYTMMVSTAVAYEAFQAQPEDRRLFDVTLRAKEDEKLPEKVEKQVKAKEKKEKKMVHVSSKASSVTSIGSDGMLPEPTRPEHQKSSL